MDDELPAWLDRGRLPRVIGREAVLERGMSAQAVDRRVMTGRWRRVLPRTYLTTDTFTNNDRVVAALTFAGRGAALSGAAALWASDVKRIPFPRRVLVIVPPDNCAASNRWVHVRRSVQPLAYELAPGPRRVELARATADLAVTMRSLDDVRTLVARVVQHGHCTLDELERALAAGPMRGRKFLREALAEVGHGAASAPEARAAHILTDHGITGWLPNQTLVLPGGREREVDFYWPRLRAVLEIDSVEWHYEVEEWSGTWDRHLNLSTYGYSVVHRPPSALRNPTRFATEVEAWLAGREADLRRGLG